MNLTESQAEAVIRLPFAYSGMLPMVPGSYDLRIILRNRACAARGESACLKSYTLLESSVDVPEWDTVTPRLSEVVLAYGKEYPSDRPLHRPYRFGTVQLLPNPRRVYAIGDSVVAMAEPLNAGSGSAVRFRIVNPEAPDPVLIERSARLGEFRLEPVLQEFSLEGFTAGRYRLVVDLLAPTAPPVAEADRPLRRDAAHGRSRASLRSSWLQVVPEVPGLVKMALGQQHLNLENRAKARGLFEAAITVNPDLDLPRESLPACSWRKATLRESSTFSSLCGRVIENDMKCWRFWAKPTSDGKLLPGDRIVGEGD
jgi:hypothetical protein